MRHQSRNPVFTSLGAIAKPLSGENFATAIVAAFLFASLILLNGCIGAAVGAGAATGIAVVQERSVGNAVDDVGIHVQINQKLFEKDEALYRRVGVTVTEGRVVLTGVVPLPEDRVEAARLTWEVGAVREVNNEIQVDDSSSVVDFLKDSWITTKLRGLILADGNILDINYSIETINGTVYLMGIAQSENELALLTNHARNVRGVTQVVSHVRVQQKRN